MASQNLLKKFKHYNFFIELEFYFILFFYFTLSSNNHLLLLHSRLYAWQSRVSPIEILGWVCGAAHISFDGTQILFFLLSCYYYALNHKLIKWILTKMKLHQMLHFFLFSSFGCRFLLAYYSWIHFILKIKKTIILKSQLGCAEKMENHIAAM